MSAPSKTGIEALDQGIASLTESASRKVAVSSLSESFLDALRIAEIVKVLCEARRIYLTSSEHSRPTADPRDPESVRCWLVQYPMGERVIELVDPAENPGGFRGVIPGTFVPDGAP